MKQDDLAAALARLLEPTTAELAEEDAVVPYWAMRAEEGSASPATAVGAGFAPDLADFLSDAFADGSAPVPSLADVAAYVDGALDAAERERFEAALVASPDLRAEVEALVERIAALDEDEVEPAAPFDAGRPDGPRSGRS